MYSKVSNNELFANSCQNSIKSSISQVNLTTKDTRKASPKLSPFSKYCQNLSPLNHKGVSSYKYQREGSITKFSVEFMKTPTVQRIHPGNEDNWLREATPERIEFDLEKLNEENYTPTFNSQLSDHLKEEFPFLEDKENQDKNIFYNNIQIEEGKNELVDKSNNGEDSKSERNRRKRKRASKLPDVKIKGSTSPESNNLVQNEESHRIMSENILKANPRNHFQIKKIRNSQEKQVIDLLNKENKIAPSKPKKRELKKDRKEEKGCTCKKSQCKKLYCECFLKQKL